MIYRASFLLLIFSLLVSFDFGNPGEPQDRILALYQKADALFHLTNSTPSTDSMALAGFGQVIDGLERTPAFAGKDTLLFQSWLKKGILLDVKYDYTGAKNAYRKALDNHKEDDSLAFVASIYAGASYYNLNNFDSANYFLLKAESLRGRVRDLDDEVRLYNTLGVLYYDNGNYRQGKNYFNRALEIVKAKQPFDTLSAVSLQTNIATSFYRLGLYEESLAIYTRILGYRIFTDQINMNMGRAYAGLEKFPQALACFRKVNAAKIPAVTNEMGHTQFQLHRPDSAAWYLDQLKTPGKAGRLNELDLGINELYRADLLAGQDQYLPSLKSLQKAIIIFSRNFNNEDIFSNPGNFTGAFAYYRLFDALFKKAEAFESLYKTGHEEKYLAASYEAYKATLVLLRYIEKSYDTDDAKLFLKKRNSTVYRGALTVCLELNALHPKDAWLQQAFMISEKSKASIITANLKEKVSARIPGIEETLLQKERNIKYNIARLNVKSEEAPDGKEIAAIAKERAGYEIDLARLQKELEQNGAYYKLKYDDADPGITELQQSLGRGQALISFAATTDALHIFALTRSGFSYARVDSLPALQHDVEGWIYALKTTENGRKFNGEAIGARLYRQLVKPILALVPQTDEWIIVPDGFLYFLPFESLPADAESTTLLEKITISYQFSSRLILNAGQSAAGTGPGSGKVLAFAPFAEKGGGFGQGSGVFSQLPASREEIAGLKGSTYIDSLATKERFLKEINKFPIVHLATHAVSSVDNAAASFIAFYPGKKARIEDCLYLEELYGLNMNATELVIISACETGQGELVSNEGVISLARAFAYAGCASTVNSLWKADDKATSDILRQFHIYLQKGYTKSRALQQAKLDYLHSDALNKSPAYWAHLILIGNTEPVYTSGYLYKWGLLLAALIALGGIGWMIVRRRKK